MRHIGRIGLTCLIGVLSPVAHADISAEMAQASTPLSEGVPEVAVVRLQSLLNKDLPEPQWRAVAEKLAEAQVAANEPEATLVLLTDARLRDLAWAKFWRAQALASLNRWTDALPLYEELSNDLSPFQTAAVFGAGDALRALGKRQEALKKFILLAHDKEWGTRAQLRAGELYIEFGNAPEARRLLEQLQPVSVAERRERRVLRGRLELISHRPERAIGMFQAILKRPEGTPHPILLAALFGIAEAHLQLKTPETGDDVLERFIDRNHADPDLPLIFAKLDELYRAEHRPSRNELEKWVRRPEQPRRTFARWYLARLEIRAGRRERAAQLFSDLRRTSIKSTAIAQALVEFAQFELDERNFDEAIAILDDARVSEAWVGLAELAFHSSPPRLNEARKNLAHAFESTPTTAAAERADYLSIWVEEAAGGNETKVIELAEKFLEQPPLSPFASEVRMKLAELYYRRQDFANAQTQFELIAQNNADSSLAEKAIFFAAESAMSSMGEHSLDRALVLFDQVVQKNGPLRWAARNRQAVIERKLGKAKDALAL